MSAKLLCIAGPGAGREFSLNSGRVVVGRSSKATVQIRDPSVSREHLEVTRGESSIWVAKDVGSRNGTRLNGRLMPGESTLSKGDVLTLGKTELRFITEQVTPRLFRQLPLRLWNAAGLRSLGRRKIGLIAALALLALFAAMKIRAVAAQANTDRQQDELLHTQAELATIFQAGKTLVREGKWEEGLGKFEQVHQRAPEMPGLQAYLDRAKVEVPNQRLLASALVALQANQLGVAADALRKVSRDTQMHQRLSLLQSQLAERQGPRLARAQEALESREYEEVLALTEDLLRAFPGNQAAELLREQAQEGIAALEGTAATPRAPKPWDSAVARFREGDLARAQALAAGCASKKVDRCAKLLREMREFEALSRKLEELDLRGLDKLIALDAQISVGKPTPMARPAMNRAAGFYYKSASAAKAEGRWRQSSELARKAVHLNPNHSGALALVGELSAKAKELFLLAYAVKDTLPDEAVQKMKEVIEMTPPSDETHLKAVSWVEKLSK